MGMITTRTFCALLLAVLVFAKGAGAQFIGFTSPQTTQETLFTAVAVTGPSSNVRNLGQSVHYLTYTTSGTLTELSIQLEGCAGDVLTVCAVAGAGWIRISETATATTVGAIFANVYLPFVRANLTTLAGTSPTVTAVYTGTSVTAGPPAGVFNTSGINNNSLANTLAADTTVSFDVELPTGGTGGILYLTFSAAGYAGATLDISAGSDTAHLASVLAATTLAAVDTTQSFRVTATSANVAHVTYTTAGATAVTFDLSYAFGGAQSAAVDILSIAAGTNNIGSVNVDNGQGADGAAVSGNPLRIAGKDSAGVTQDFLTTSNGAPVVSGQATFEDAFSNLGAFLATDSGANRPLGVYPFHFNGVSWDRARGDTSGALVQGPAAAGAAVAGNPVLMGGFDGTNAQTILVTAGGRQVFMSSSAASDASSNSIASPLTGATLSFKQAVSNFVFNGTTWDRQRGDTTGTQVIGPGADGAAVAGKPVRIAGKDDSGNTQDLLVDPAGNLAFPIESGEDNFSNSALVGLTFSDGTTMIPGRWSFNGTTWDRDYICSQSAIVTLTASGNTQIIALGAGQIVRICHLSLSFDAVSDFSLHEGTGANCATGDTAITGVYQDINSITLDFGAVAALRGSSAQALCANLGTAINAGGVITYAQF